MCIWKKFSICVAFCRKLLKDTLLLLLLRLAKALPMGFRDILIHSVLDFPIVQIRGNKEKRPKKLEII